MSIVEEIIAAIESKIDSLLPIYKKAKFAYEIDKNNRKNSEKIYSVKPMGGSSSQNMTLSATFKRDFEVLFSDIYQPKNDTDSNITVKIMTLEDAIQILYTEIYQKRLDLTSAKVLLVELVNISEPQIDLENNSVSVTALFTINYRTQL